MFECKLEDFQNYRPKLLRYASSLLKTRGFTDRAGELKAHSEDVVSQAYIEFHKYGTNKYVNEKHLENFLISVVYNAYLQAIDINRRGAQYILLKKDTSSLKFKEELKQLDIRKPGKPDQEFFDVISSFKEELSEKEVLILNGLLDGYSQKEISKKLDLGIGVVNRNVMSIKEKYNKYEK